LPVADETAAMPGRATVVSGSAIDVQLRQLWSKVLQLMLNQRGGFPVLIEDGAFGPATEASVNHYQQNENLSVDGVVGKQTWTSLLSKWLLQSEPG
jgi:peptidoglycan hydrolase-like protein with peptidoglycan-binding domain